MSCSPHYAYRPKPVTGITQCVAPGFAEHRSRLTIAGLFFRSKKFGDIVNNISVEIVDNHFNVYVNDVDIIEAETYPVTLGPGGIAQLRASISNNPSSVIEMPVLNYDVYDTRTVENDNVSDGTLPAGGLVAFSKTHLTGGSGGPTTGDLLDQIHTGPDRSIIIIETTENDDGSTNTNVPESRKVQQWNGSKWIEYSNKIPGACPLEGTN